MQKIIPFLWFDNQAEEAVHFYTSVFNNSEIGNLTYYGDDGHGVEGTVMTVSFEIEGQQFMALNGGPYFKFTPAISFFVNCETKEKIDGLWEKLSTGGTVLMELGQYPFSEKFGWLMDKFGVFWQLNLAEGRQKINTYLMFVGGQHGKAEHAVHFYVSLFKNSSINHIERFGVREVELEGTVKLALFNLHGQGFMAMDGGLEHSFTFTPAISLFVNCESQEEVDVLWDKLSEGGEREDCGWLKDKFGVSWQIVPVELGEMLQDKDPGKVKRVMKALLQMKKIDIDSLRQAYKKG
jgi:predicted 3-demethylubiquinone-9 3-methyltransferase (glyoxalase superfamily)